MKLSIIKLTLFALLISSSACSTIASDPRTIQQSEATIDEQFKMLGELLLNANLTAKRVSSWSIEEHIEHILLVNKNVAIMLNKAEKPDPVVEKDKLAVFKTLKLGSISRGTVAAPKRVQPKGLSKKQLKVLLKQTAALYEKLDYEQFINNTFVPGNHPYLGGLTSVEWMRFVEVHTKHHLKIIRDIESNGLTTKVGG